MTLQMPSGLDLLGDLDERLHEARGVGQIRVAHDAGKLGEIPAPQRNDVVGAKHLHRSVQTGSVERRSETLVDDERVIDLRTSD
jgi:hypothetical protein